MSRVCVPATPGFLNRLLSREACVVFITICKGIFDLALLRPGHGHSTLRFARGDSATLTGTAFVVTYMKRVQHEPVYRLARPPFKL
jgi:hypothetical protein